MKPSLLTRFHHYSPVAITTHSCLPASAFARSASADRRSLGGGLLAGRKTPETALPPEGGSHDGRTGDGASAINMADKEYEIPVKVVDRRRWANQDAEGGGAAATSPLKPTYVEELERQLADKDQQLQDAVVALPPGRE